MNLAKCMGINAHFVGQTGHHFRAAAIKNLLVDDLASTDVGNHRAVVVEHVIVFRLNVQFFELAAHAVNRATGRQNHFNPLFASLSNRQFGAW